MYYLEVLKDITEFTGIEYWIKEQIKAGLTDWIPVDESLRDDTADDKINLLYDKLAKRGLHIDKTLLQ